MHFHCLYCGHITDVVQLIRNSNFKFKHIKYPFESETESNFYILKVFYDAIPIYFYHVIFILLDSVSSSMPFVELAVGVRTVCGIMRRDFHRTEPVHRKAVQDGVECRLIGNLNLKKLN